MSKRNKRGQIPFAVQLLMVVTLAALILLGAVLIDLTLTAYPELLR